MRRAGIAMISLGALVCCNSIVGFDNLIRVSDSDAGAAPSGGGGNGSSSSSSGSAAEAGARARCDPTQDFGAATLITELDGTQSTKRAIMTPDELEIFYLLGDTVPYSLRHAIRASRDATWNAPVTETLDPDASGLGSIAVDGLKLYYWHLDNSTTSISSVPAVATRTQLQTPFANGSELLSETDQQIVVTNTDDTAYWAAYLFDDGGIVEETIFRGVVTGTHVANGVAVPSLHVSGAQDDAPTLVGNQELTIYFASTRDPSFGASDVWRASRLTATTDFDPPTHVIGASSTDPDEPSWVSADECVMLLDRLRHFYIMQRPTAH